MPFYTRRQIEELHEKMVSEARRCGKLLPLLPGHRCYLIADDRQQGKRFAGLFRSTWRRIPLGDRRAILRYWRFDGQARFPLYLWVGLVDVWPEPKRRRGVFAGVKREGRQLCFWLPIVRLMPDPLVCDLIAHEMAHVFQYAGCRMDHSDKRHVEGHADYMARDWGFSDTGLDDWATVNLKLLKRIGF